MDYIENQCAKTKESERTCDYVEYENTDLGFADLQVNTESKEEVLLSISPCALQSRSLNNRL